MYAALVTTLQMYLCIAQGIALEHYLTPFLIDPYHEIFFCLANYDKALKLLHQKLAHETIFSDTHSDWFKNDRIIHLTNQHIFHIGLTFVG